MHWFKLIVCCQRFSLTVPKRNIKDLTLSALVSPQWGVSRCPVIGSSTASTHLAAAAAAAAAATSPWNGTHHPIWVYCLLTATGQDANYFPGVISPLHRCWRSLMLIHCLVCRPVEKHRASLTEWVFIPVHNMISNYLDEPYWTARNKCHRRLIWPPCSEALVDESAPS